MNPKLAELAFRLEESITNALAESKEILEAQAALENAGYEIRVVHKIILEKTQRKKDSEISDFDRQFLKSFHVIFEESS